MAANNYPPAPAMAGMCVVARLALDELRSHRTEVPDHLAAVVDDAWRVVGPVEFPESAYATAALLLHQPEHGIENL
jgi:hypothetical protein